MNCSQIVPHPHDGSPARSPQAVHTALLPLFFGKDVVEIGTRHGDDIVCYAHVAKSIAAFEIDTKSCHTTQIRLHHLAAKICKSNINCYDFLKATGSDLSFDILVWWQHTPHLADAGILVHLSRTAQQRQLRPGAVAMTMHDMKNDADVRSYRRLRPRAAWEKAVEFDERVDCCNRRSPRRPPDCAARSNLTRFDSSITCDRAYGIFIVQAFNLTRAPSVQSRLR
mgnify:CR=1 FL=1